ncbi:translation initiation factor IF-2, mitochondrial [Anthonomus grandis grandis]|uniref:translation initiation factor IF-2, mitochondrial n=1 Tax=Anthonomus grandis grandis TaxID=2921223 RepID=UPI002165B473|nr:translation initiation factor IF-2, mitochondrial [Anthonomus grandis grandis]
MAIHLKNVKLQALFGLGAHNLQTCCGHRSLSHLSIPKARHRPLQHIDHYRTIHLSVVNFKKRRSAEEKKSPRSLDIQKKSKGELVDVWQGITLTELAHVLQKDIRYVKDIFLNEINDPNTAIYDLKYLHNGIRRAGKRMKIVARPSNEEEKEKTVDLRPRPPPSKDQLKPRPPVVTVMGHVDHGKTTLLDALRHSSVVEQEFGGITQHIGAFLVTLPSGAKITFLDTPGHAAFSSMRARGANLTDIVVLVVAADDGVMEQTVESVRMARNANVPILVAINKIDAPKADVPRTERTLIEIGIQVENQGGEVQSVPISALKRQNLNQLTEALILQADLLELGGDPGGPVEAVIVESNVHPHRGKLSTVVVQRGTLKRGDVLVAGTAMGKVRTIKDADGREMDAVPPGYPAEIDGWKELPGAGEIVLEAESERVARQVIKLREEEQELKRLEQDLKVIEQKQEAHNQVYKEKLKRKRLMGWYRLKPEGPRQPEIQEVNGPPAFNIIVKADVDGTLEAILETLDTYESDECRLDIVHYGVGPITRNDIEMAAAFNAVIYAFNVAVPGALKNVLLEENVTVKPHNVIYKLIEDFKEEINSRLPPKEIEETLGEAEVLQQFEIGKGRKLVPVAGCRCTKGILQRDALFKVIRNGEIIHTGPLSSMRHLKSETNVIKADTECGLQLEDHEVQFEKGDKIVCFVKKVVKQVTDWDPGF